MTHIGTLEVANESVVVLYDPATGYITHMHHSVTMKGGAHPDQATLEKDAFAHLAEAQPQVTAKMAVLHVDPGSLKYDGLYKVDTAKRAMVELPAAPRRAKE